MKIGVSRPAVFLDRDGVLTEEKGYIFSIGELNIFSYTAKCVEQIHKKGYWAIVVTNQSGVARGFFTEREIQEMNQYLISKTNVDAVYYCPHHPEGSVIKYRKKCHCRKPEIGMFERACQDFNIAIEKSYMVGDRADDIIAGQRAGFMTMLLESGYGTKRLEKDVRPDYILGDLRDVINIL